MNHEFFTQKNSIQFPDEDEDTEEIEFDNDIDTAVDAIVLLQTPHQQFLRRQSLSLERNVPVMSLNFSFCSNPHEALKLALDHQHSVLSEEANKWFALETKTNHSGGYECMWKTCPKVIVKGRGNFEKHLKWHLSNLKKEWNRLLVDSKEWAQLKKERGWHANPVKVSS